MSVSAELLHAVQVAVDALEDYDVPRERTAADILRRYFLTGCPGCGRPLEGHVRKGQRYHSQACRVRAWRARRSAAGTPHKAVTGATEP